VYVMLLGTIFSPSSAPSATGKHSKSASNDTPSHISASSAPSATSTHAA